MPVLWDNRRITIVNNESADILRMLDTAFEHLVPSGTRLYPEEHAAEIDALNPRLYDLLNNGVYKAGFATLQAAYDEAMDGIFAMLEELEDRLTGDFLFGDTLTETDIMAFFTLVRFDAAYHGLFKTNRRQIRDTLAGEPNAITRPEICITAAIAGAVALVVLKSVGLDGNLATLVGGLVAFALRGGALAFGWTLPRYRARPGRPIDRA